MKHPYQKHHGLSKTQEYKTWSRIRRRCFDEKDRNYKDYGGRGIKMCKKWNDSFINFYSDMGLRPEGTSIERINNEKGYYKENCRWATPKEQGNNTRRNHFVTYKNKTQTLSQWAKEIGINEGVLWYRIKTKWPLEKALNKVKYINQTNKTQL